MNAIDGNFLSKEDLFKRLIYMDYDINLLKILDHPDLVIAYNNIISSNDYLKLSKIKKILEEDSQREDFDSLLLRKRDREMENNNFENFEGINRSPNIKRKK